MNESDYFELYEAYNKIGETLQKFISSNKNDDKILYELKECIDKMRRTGLTWDVEKIQAISAVLQSKEPREIQEIIAYMDQTNYGWQGDIYKFYNRCSYQCRKNFRIDNTPEMTEQALLDMEEIFLHKEYGAITTYLFGYCIASLFSSRLKKYRKSIPYFLQIACKRNSNVYRLVHEIVHICDVNTGLFEHCKNNDYRECNHDHLTLYPSETGDKLFDTLTYYRDIPIIVDGYENEKLYETLIREVANIATRNKRFDIRAKFNILPVFISPILQSQFQNVFSMDLTEFDITEEYMELIRNNEQFLGSWALELVDQAEHYFGVWNATSYSSNPKVAKLIEARNPETSTPFLYDFSDYIGRLRTKCNHRTKLTSKDVTNLGYITYFFSHYMKVFKKSVRLSVGTPFTYRGIQDAHNSKKLIEQMVEQATESVVQLHEIFSPAQPESLNFDIDIADKNEAKRIKRKMSAYAKDIVKYYKSYKVLIGITDIKYKDERYVFFVKLLPGTDAKFLSRYAEEVRRLLEVEVFRFDITSAEIRLIVSEKSLNENSLIKILDSDQFKMSEMELPYAVGYDILGEMVIANIAEFPHLLVGGTTDSGKSSALLNLLTSIVYKQPANKVKLLLFDFGSSDLNIFDKVPHMLQPTIRANEIERGRHYLLELQKEMENRLKKKDLLEKRKFDVEFRKWPSIICVIDEFQAFVRKLTTGRRHTKAYMIIEDILARARKVKIHLVIATQNASKGNIEIRNTNLGASIAFRCTNRYDSEAIIGASDAVNLSGKGTMYFRCYQFEGLKRIQGAYMSPDEIIDMIETMNTALNDDGKRYDEVEFAPLPSLKSDIGDWNIEDSAVEEQSDELLCEIIQLAIDSNKISNHMIKKRFEMGYDRSNILLEQLEKAGIISKLKGKRPRKVNLDKAKEFLMDKGYSDDAVEENLVKTVDIPSEKNNMETMQEQNIESAIEESNVPALEENTIDVVTQRQENKKKIIFSSNAKQRISDTRNKTKKGSAH